MTPGPKPRAPGLGPRHVPPEAAAFAAAEKRMLGLCARPGDGGEMLHPGFADTWAPEPDIASFGDAAVALALLGAAFALGFACGALVQGVAGWPGVAVSAGVALGLAAVGAAWATRPRPGR